jgi:hypothetical protein
MNLWFHFTCHGSSQVEVEAEIRLVGGFPFKNIVVRESRKLLSKPKFPSLPKTHKIHPHPQKTL